MKIVLYAPGCKLQTLAVDLSGEEHPTRQFECEPLSTVQLTGQLPPELVGKENAEIVVHYMAYWSHEFFGVADGLVANFEVASAKPDSSGLFEIEIPDFVRDGTVTSFKRPAALALTLLDSQTRNPMARDLEPELPEFRTETRELAIQSVYPANLRFLPVPVLSQLRQNPRQE